MILTFLRKMITSEVMDMAPEPSRSYMRIAPDAPIGWKRLSSLNYDKFPNTNATEFLLLKELGMGIEGRAWLACTVLTGLVCVIKIFHGTALEGTLNEAQTRLAKQKELWNTLWKLKTFSLTLNRLNTTAFVMPYVLTANYLHPDSLNLDPVLKGRHLARPE